ncbi:MAG: penicillin-binding transpeptidase domain-containing protein [Actinomycetota bacterium]|nr:penicillin-binding transpeptidase domain-containing protein [Actinomycetota bacterium]
MNRKGVLLAVGVVASATVVAGGSAGLLGRGDGGQLAARAFAGAWESGQLASLPWDERSGADPAGQVAALTAGLLPGPEDRPAQVTVAAVRREGDQASADLDVRWELGVPWTYRTRLPLLRTAGQWRPVLTSAVVHPALARGRVLRARVEQAPRAAITDRSGARLVTGRPVVTVGLQPSRTRDLPATVQRVAALTEVDGGALLARARAAKPDAFVEVITLRRPAYDAVRDRLRPVPGVVLREGVRQLAPSTAFARAVLGTVGPATAEVVAASGGTVRPDQLVGLSGLQRQYDSRLGGRPGLTVEAVDAAGTAAPQRVHHTAPVPGTALQVTLDPAVQQAADTALEQAPTGKRAALVAVQPSTGDVLAVANTGPDGPGVDRALTGQYPPGSTFKIASTLALLRSGLPVDEVVPCPATLTVSGKEFSNAEGAALGAVPFRTDFAESCNTAFVASSQRISPEQLQDAATDVGYRTPDLGVPAFGGQVPVSDDPVEHAANVLGQGKVLASPLAVALSAATVQAGRLHPPRLVVAPRPAPVGPRLPEAGTLQELTRLVVTSGTGTVLRSAPGGPVTGKTGTAEFATKVPPQTHAWFAGYQGDLAFAVLVEDGGFGGAVAAPLAGAFLSALRA